MFLGLLFFIASAVAGFATGEPVAGVLFGLVFLVSGALAPTNHSARR